MRREKQRSARQPPAHTTTQARYRFNSLNPEIGLGPDYRDPFRLPQQPPILSHQRQRASQQAPRRRAAASAALDSSGVSLHSGLSGVSGLEATHLLPHCALLHRSQHLQRQQQHVRVLGPAHERHEPPELLRQRKDDLVLVIDRLCTRPAPARSDDTAMIPRARRPPRPTAALAACKGAHIKAKSGSSGSFSKACAQAGATCL